MTTESTAGRVGSATDEESTLPRMSFLEHLEELRRRILISVVAIVVAFAVCWSFAPEIFAWIERPILPLLAGKKLAYTRLAAPFFLYMKVAFLASIFAAAPVILWQVWRFIAPGLYRRERLYAAPFLVFSTLFFLAGGYFGYKVVFPMAAKFFVEVGQPFEAVITVDDYFSIASKLILGMGLVFETPILIFFLARIGIVTPQFLLKKFKYAVLIIFIIAAIITPTPDMVTQSALAIPMILLYLLGVGISMVFGKNN
jgi:sec-independent protein translocase protein TatC